MQAVVLCAGIGSRLRPLTENTPKALVPVAGVPVILYILDWLKRYGIVDVAINLHHLPRAIPSFLGDGTRYGMRISYAYEFVLLGAAGALQNFTDWLTSTFLVTYGDQLADVDIDNLLNVHRARHAVATIGLRSVWPGEDLTQVGVMRLEDDGRVLSFMEKPTAAQIADWQRQGSVGINGGVYILEPTVLDLLPRDISAPFDFGYDLLPELLRRSLPVVAVSMTGYLLDIGSPAQLEQAEADVRSGKMHLPADSFLASR